jgi:hypothetical protein
MKKIIHIFLRILALGATTGILAGCATDDPDNLSSVPWNSPKSWEGPMPSTFNQGR